MKAKIDEIVSALEFHSDEVVAYLNNKTGKVLEISDECMQIAESGDDDDEQPKWMSEPIADARSYLEHPDQHLELPSSSDINEYRMMEDFCFECENEKHKEQLLQAIKRKGAFRRFKDKAGGLGLIDSWYVYHSNALHELAIKWCKENNIAYVEKNVK